MRTYKLGDKVKIRGHHDIEFEINEVKSFLYFLKGSRKEGVLYTVIGRHGLTISGVYHELIVTDDPEQSLDELLDTYNSFLKLEGIYQNGKYKEAAGIVMEEIHRLYGY